jgi:hypothetical protein
MPWFPSMLATNRLLHSEEAFLAEEMSTGFWHAKYQTVKLPLAFKLLTHQMPSNLCWEEAEYQIQRGQAWSGPMTASERVLG